MNFPCPDRNPCLDDATSLGNYSAEKPDVALFKSVRFNGQIWDGGQFYAVACLGFCEAPTQAEADLCALRQQAQCIGSQQFLNAAVSCQKDCNGVQGYSVPAGLFVGATQAQADALAAQFCQTSLDTICGGGTVILPPGMPHQTPNEEQTCSVNCTGPGATFTAKVAAGEVYGANQADANMRAYSLACQRASALMACLEALSPTGCCANVAFDTFISLIPPGTGPWVWQMSGSLPAGLAFTFNASAAHLSGVPTATGTFQFALQVTDAAGNVSVRSYVLTVLDITTASPLPSVEANNAYSATIAASGGVLPYSFQVDSGALPTGLTLDETTGIISGTPTVPGNYSFTISVQDSAT